MTAPAALVQLVEPWSQLYSDSTLIATIVVFAHIAALMFAGGLAITVDRGTLRASREPANRSRHLLELSGAHRLVVAGLVLSVISGLLLFASDVETYWVSPVYWSKMGLIALLLLNGFVMTRTEAALRQSKTSPDAGWSRLKQTAIVSVVLWFAIAFAGVALVNAA